MLALAAARLEKGKAYFNDACLGDYGQHWSLDELRTQGIPAGEDQLILIYNEAALDCGKAPRLRPSLTLRLQWRIID
jgi:hypothetical protein